MIKFKTKKYKSFEECFIASFCQQDDMTIDECKETIINGVTSDGKEVEFTFDSLTQGMKKQKHWGWVDDKNTIHFWIGENVPLEELIHFFAHEIGHKTGTPYKTHMKEEMRAEGYGYAAALAYKLAIKNQKNTR